MTTSAPVQLFADFVRDRLFTPRPRELRRVGVEIEMLALLAENGWPCPLETPNHGGPSTLGFLRQYGAAHQWRELRSSKGSPFFELPNGSTLTFEPGGQLELCTPARSSVSALLRETCSTLTALRTAAANGGIELLSVGIDPENGIERIPLQLHSARYVEMTRYFDSIGPSGVKMMRQTAATQVSVDPGAMPEERWRLLCDLAPYLTAIFANSSRYAGGESGYQSYRARCWRLLDPSRTGVPQPAIPATEAYTRFALDAVDMTRTTEAGEYRPFADWAADGSWSEADWANHLTTLFPEVRPRGHLEVRCIDALKPEMLGAAVVLIAGLVYDPRAAAAARDLVPPADEEMLNRAARCGLHDSTLGDTAVALTELALRGAAALGEAYITGADRERAADFYRELTRQRRSPAGVR
jgi:glutamate--cysteine ligase